MYSYKRTDIDRSIEDAEFIATIVSSVGSYPTSSVPRPYGIVYCSMLNHLAEASFPIA